MTPTQRSLKQLRLAGWLCAVTERWNPHVKIRQDLFGFADLIAVKGDECRLIQTTSGAKRKFIGSELKRSYWDAAKDHLTRAAAEREDLFSLAGVAV